MAAEIIEFPSGERPAGNGLEGDYEAEVKFLPPTEDEKRLLDLIAQAALDRAGLDPNAALAELRDRMTPDNVIQLPLDK